MYTCIHICWEDFCKCFVLLARLMELQWVHLSSFVHCAVLTQLEVNERLTTGGQLESRREALRRGRRLEERRAHVPRLRRLGGRLQSGADSWRPQLGQTSGILVGQDFGRRVGGQVTQQVRHSRSGMRRALSSAAFCLSFRFEPTTLY